MSTLILWRLPHILCGNCLYLEHRNAACAFRGQLYAKEASFRSPSSDAPVNCCSGYVLVVEIPTSPQSALAAEIAIPRLTGEPTLLAPAGRSDAAG